MREFIVKSFIHDAELEVVLNTICEKGYFVKEIFRNTPGVDGQETSTVVFQIQKFKKVKHG